MCYDRTVEGCGTSKLVQLIWDTQRDGHEHDNMPSSIALLHGTDHPQR